MESQKFISFVSTIHIFQFGMDTFTLQYRKRRHKIYCPITILLQTYSEQVPSTSISNTKRVIWRIQKHPIVSFIYLVLSIDVKFPIPVIPRRLQKNCLQFLALIPPKLDIV